MEFVDYVRVVRRGWKLVFSIALLGLVVAAAFALISPKQYGAQAKVYVNLAQVSPGTAYQSNQYVLSLMPSYTELNGSPQVLGPVIKQLGLNETVEDLASDITISNPAGTVYLDVDVTSGSLTGATRLAAATSRQLASVIAGLQQSTTSARVIIARAQPVTSSTTPVSPRVPLDLALGVVGGLVLGMIWALVRNRLDTSIRDAPDLRRLIGVPPLARVPMAAASSEELPVDSLTEAELPRFRALRTAISIGSAGRLPASIAVVPVDSADGPWVAAGLAQAAARSGLKTCLVDADLRRSHSLEILAADSETGLTEVLELQTSLSATLTAWGDAEVPLALVGPGRGSDDAADLLDSAAMREVHRVLRANFDLVVFSVPPATESTDAVIVSRDAAASVVVVRMGSTARSSFGDTALMLDTVHANLSGVVVIEPVRRRQRRSASRETILERPHSGPSAALLRLVDAPAITSQSADDGAFVVPPRQILSPRSARHAHIESETGARTTVLPPRARSSRARRSSGIVPQPGVLDGATGPNGLTGDGLTGDVSPGDASASDSVNLDSTHYESAARNEGETHFGSDRSQAYERADADADHDGLANEIIVGRASTS